MSDAMAVDVEQELRLLREQIAGLEARLDQVEDSDLSANLSFSGITTRIDAYPTMPGVMFAVHVTEILGGATEGSAASVAVQMGNVLALHIGDIFPPEGTEVLVTLVPYAFVFQYGKCPPAPSQ